MTVKASISLTDSQDSYARTLVANGRFPSLSAVMQHGLELLRREAEMEETELATLRALLEDRRSGAFISVEDGQARTEAMLNAKRVKHGLQG